jgi:hypothetical protein
MDNVFHHFFTVHRIILNRGGVFVHNSMGSSNNLIWGDVLVFPRIVPRCVVASKRRAEDRSARPDRDIDFIRRRGAEALPIHFPYKDRMTKPFSFVVAAKSQK